MMRHIWQAAVVLLGLALVGLSAHAADGDFVWARGMGGTGGEFGRGIAVDGSSNVYTTGYFEGMVDFDTGAGTANLTSAGSGDIFVQKLDASGNLVWAQGMGGTGSEESFGIAVDGAGNVYTTGRFVGTVDFDPGAGTANLTSSGSFDIFVQKLDANGNLVWARRMGGTSYAGGQGIAVDGVGNVYTAGYFEDTADFDPGANTLSLTSAGSGDVFVQRLDASGNLVWARRMGGTGLDDGVGIAVDGTGSIYTTGSFEGTADFDPGAGTANLTTAGNRDIFVQKLDASGNLVWARSMGGTGFDRGQGIAMDGAGNVYTTGFFEGTADFDPGTATVNLTSAGSGDIFVQKLDASGNQVWARGMGGTSNDRGYAIAVDSAGNVCTSGYFQSTADFDPGAGTIDLTSAGSDDIFVQMLDASGNLIWARGMGGTSGDGGHAIAVDDMGNVFTTGWFQDTADFDPGAGTANLTSAGLFDIFVSKLTGPPDTSPPNAISIYPATTGPTNATSVAFTVTFDEDVQNFDALADVTLTHTGTASTGVSITGGPSTYTATVTGISGYGSFTLSVNTGSDVQDLAGNALASSVASASVQIVPVVPNLPLIAWPLGLALAAAGGLALRRKTRK